MRHGKTIDGSDVSLPVEIGGLIGDRYAIERIVGEGLTSVVYAARDGDQGQRVALKFLVREHVQRGAALEKFRRETLAAAGFASAYACRVLDVRTLDNGVPYVVMEYLEGCNLATELNCRTRLPPMEALGYVLEACEPVSEAHAAGIIHRDLKLENLFLVNRPDGSRHVKVMDFGVPNVLLDTDSQSRSLPMSIRALGSLAYKAPEQLDVACDIDARVDVWSLGVVLYELLTGRRPFGGGSIAALVKAVLHEPPSAFFAASVIAPDGLETVLHKALSKSREERYGSVAEFAAALAPFAPEAVLQNVQIASVRTSGAVPLGSSTIELDADQLFPEDAPMPPRSGRGKLVAAFTICALLVVALFVWLRPQPQPTSPPVAAAAHASAPPTFPTPNPPPAAPPPPASPSPASPAAPPQPSAAVAVASKPQPSAAAAAAPPQQASVVAWRPRPQPSPPSPTPAPVPAKPAAPSSVTDLPDFGGRR